MGPKTQSRQELSLKTEAWKKLTPKTEVQKVKLRESISTYDSTIRSEDAYLLQYLYCNDTKTFCGSIKLDILARVLARVYGPSMTHRGLRHMIIALLMSNSKDPTITQCATYTQHQHVDIAYGVLRRRLANPVDVDEGDIFVAYMLALWSGQIDLAACETHINGVLAIMRHVSGKLGALADSCMAPFWAFLRDEIIWLTRASNKSFRLCHEFRELLGPKTVQQRHSYEIELRGAMKTPSRFQNDKVLFGRSIYTSVHTLIHIATVINHRHYRRSDVQDALSESVLVELGVDQRIIEQQQHEKFLEIELKPLERGEYLPNWREEVKVVRRFHDLLVLHVCRIVKIVLEARSVQEGLSSIMGVREALSFISVTRRARMFVQAGIHGSRVFGTGTSLCPLFG